MRPRREALIMRMTVNLFVILTVPVCPSHLNRISKELNEAEQRSADHEDDRSVDSVGAIKAIVQIFVLRKSAQQIGKRRQ